MLGPHAARTFLSQEQKTNLPFREKKSAPLIRVYFEKKHGWVLKKSRFILKKIRLGFFECRLVFAKMPVG